MKREADFFDDHDPCLVYIAKRLSHATRIEKLFDEAGVDYGVEADTYLGGVIFRSERVGAFFYVRTEAEERARKVLSEQGFKPHEGPVS